MTNRIALFLLLAPVSACKCGPDLNGITESVLCCVGTGCVNAAVSTPWDAGALGVGYVEVSGKSGVSLVAVGQSSVQISGIAIVDDGGGFTLADGGDGGYLGTFLASGQSLPIDVTFDPKRPGADIGYLVVTTDNGPIACEMIGEGIDECANINLDGGCDAGIGECAGTCTNGGCQWAPPTTACTDGTKCITEGTCDGTGHCDGPDSCVPVSGCDGGIYELYQADAGTGYCNGAPTPYQQGTCLYVPPRVLDCDCGCGMNQDGTTGCLYSWALDATAPDAGFGSAWASQSGDVWASTSTGPRAGNTIPQAFYERVNGTWTQMASLPFGSNPLTGSGGTIALTGDQSGDVYGASACSFEDQQTDCGDAGVWKWSNGSATVELLAPPSFSNGCGQGSVSDFAQSYPVLLGSTAAVLNSDPCGPELMTEANGAFSILGGSQLPVNCSANGSIWGTSTTDVYISWGCSENNAGGIWHYTGAGLTAAPDFQFTAGNHDYAAAIAGTSDGDIWAVGTQRWHNDGTGWTVSSMPAPNGEVDSSLWSVGDQTYFAGGNYSGVYHFANSAWTLECLAPGYSGEDPGVAQVAGDNAGNFYAATHSGIFKRQ